MQDIQNILYEKLNNNKYGSMLLHYAAILIYISVGHGILELLPMPSIINMLLAYSARIIYYGYVAGLIGCFAKKEYLPVTLIFALNALTSLISCIRWHSFSSILNILVYGALGYFAFIHLAKGGSNTLNTKAGGKRFCPSCGQEVPADVSFCGNCGNRF